MGQICVKGPKTDTTPNLFDTLNAYDMIKRFTKRVRTLCIRNYQSNIINYKYYSYYLLYNH